MCTCICVSLNPHHASVSSWDFQALFFYFLQGGVPLKARKVNKNTNFFVFFFADHHYPHHPLLFGASTYLYFCNMHNYIRASKKIRPNKKIHHHIQSRNDGGEKYSRERSIMDKKSEQGFGNAICRPRKKYNRDRGEKWRKNKPEKMEALLGTHTLTQIIDFFLLHSPFSCKNTISFYSFSRALDKAATK